MRIINLIENTPGIPGCLCEHGLSFYVETGKHRILVDTGATDAFSVNAEKLDIDLRQVDMVIISHGHYDHTGGILKFAALNPRAKIWIQRLAGEEYYHKNAVMEKYIGMDPQVKALPQIEWVDGDRKIDEGIFLFGNVTGRKQWPSGNRELAVKRNGEFRQDEFRHEQYLVLEEGKRRILFSGCAHNGILNILDRYVEIYGSDPDVLISGFHMNRKNGYREEDLKLIRDTGTELRKRNTYFYTGHCTGELPFEILKEVMGDQLHYVHSGEELCLSCTSC